MFSYFSKDNNLGTLSMWLLIITCFGYPITAVPIAMSALPSTPINMSLKAIYCAVAIFIIIISIYKKNLHFSKTAYFLILFWVIYSIRLVYDISILDIRLAKGSGNSETNPNTAFYIYSYFFMSSIIPALAIMISTKLIDLAKLTGNLIFVLAVANVEVALYLYQNIAMAGKDLFLERANIYSQVDDGPEGIVLNTILIGYIGQQLAVNSLGRVLVIKGESIFKKLLLVGFIVLGIFNIVVAASRSPFLSLAVLVLILIFYNFRFQAKAVRYWLSASVVVFFISILTIVYIMPFIENNDLAIINRLIEFQSDRSSGGKEYRDFAYASALNDFFDSPIFGKQYVGTYDNFYPHNVILEALMATGVVGFLVFLVAIFAFIFKAFQALQPGKKYLFLCLLFVLPKFAISLSSGCLFIDPEFWILFGFFISI
ncbi:MAG: O-antigen ligase family protein [Saprospiraceae bacterium]